MRNNLNPEDGILYISAFYRELLVNLALSTNPTSDENRMQIERFIENVIRICSQ